MERHTDNRRGRAGSPFKGVSSKPRAIRLLLSEEEASRLREILEADVAGGKSAPAKRLRMWTVMLGLVVLLAVLTLATRDLWTTWLDWLLRYLAVREWQ